MRDVLKGTLRWSQGLLDEDEISINYNHFKPDSSTSDSPVTDSSPDIPKAPPSHPSQNPGKAAERRLFYVSSEENSEAIESPSESINPVTQNKVFKLPSNIEVELEELKSALGVGRKGASRKSSGPNNLESEFSKSWSPESESARTSPEDEESPNPLYRIRKSSYDT